MHTGQATFWFFPSSCLLIRTRYPPLPYGVLLAGCPAGPVGGQMGVVPGGQLGVPPTGPAGGQLGVVPVGLWAGRHKKKIKQ